MGPGVRFGVRCSGARTRLARALVALAAPSLAALAGCQALPPAHRVVTEVGSVHSDGALAAREMADALEELAPRVAALLPGARPRRVDVWVQEEPHLFRFGRPAHQEADGFWAQGPGRIHLRAGADDPRRTLAHELVHAFLGPEWDALPGTLEEGLCDWISGLAVPTGARRMRAGRLSAAAFCLGGLALRIEVTTPPDPRYPGMELAYGATVVLEGILDSPLDPLEVFQVRAGLSTVRVPAARKKALYGLAYLVIGRAVERVGLDGLHALCLRARAEGRSSVPEEWLLEAADLPPGGAAAWGRVIEDELGRADLAELVEMYPDFLLSTVRQLLPDPEAFESLSVRLGSPGSEEALHLVLLPPAPAGVAGVWRPHFGR